MKKVYAIPFGADFINELKRLILSREEDLEKVAVIFPGKRPSLYLRKELARHIGRPFAGPSCFSMEEFINVISTERHPGFTDIDLLDAVFLLFQHIRNSPAMMAHNTWQGSFDAFFHWGRHLARFINDLDTECVHTDKLKSVEKNAGIGYDVPEYVNVLLSNIAQLRDAYHETLGKMGFFTRGYRYLSALESVKEGYNGNFQALYFSGFFGLTAVEREIISTLWKRQGGEIVLEGNPAEWPVLEDFLSFLGATTEFIDCEKIQEQEIRIFSGSDTHGEVLSVAGVLRGESGKKTAVVLPRADILFPLVTMAIIESGLPWNVSLGYPLSRTTLFDLLDRIITIQTERRQSSFYRASSYLALVGNPFVKNMSLGEEIRALFTSIQRAIKGEERSHSDIARPYLMLDEIEEFIQLQGNFSENITSALNSVHTIMIRNFENLSTIGEMSSRLEEVLDFLLANTGAGSYVLSGEIFRSAYELLERLKTSLPANEPFSGGIKTLCDIFRHHLSSVVIPFDTRPLEELEVLGVLETRNLSFERIIVLDMNEGIIPGPKVIDPLIPIGIYEKLGIPTPEQNEEIYHYNFSRLIRSSREVCLVYRESEEAPRSRYIEQIVWEAEKKAGKLHVLPVTKTHFPANLAVPERLPTIEKTGEIVALLQSKSYSATSVDRYLACPVLFFYTEILGFEEPGVLGDDIEASERGQIIHDVLRDTFSPFIGKELHKGSTGELLKSLAESMRHIFSGRVVTGDYYLFRHVAERKLISFLKSHFGNLKSPLVARELESSFRGTIDIKGMRLALKGRIDRIDFLPEEDSYVIIDYKTGGAAHYPRTIEKTDFFSIEDIRKRIKSFQLPLYVYLFCSTRNIPVERVSAKLIMLKEGTDDQLFKNMPGDQRKTLQERMMNGIRTVLAEVLDSSKPFTPQDSENCTICPYSHLCHV